MVANRARMTLFCDAALSIWVVEFRVAVHLNRFTVSSQNMPLNLFGTLEKGQWREWVDDCVPLLDLEDHDLKPGDSGRVCSVGRSCPLAVGSGIAGPQTTRSLWVETECQSSCPYCYRKLTG